MIIDLMIGLFALIHAIAAAIVPLLLGGLIFAMIVETVQGPNVRRK